MIKGDILSGALSAPTRRSLLTMIGKIGGAAAMYQAMTALGHAAETRFTGPPGLSGARPGSSRSPWTLSDLRFRERLA